MYNHVTLHFDVCIHGHHDVIHLYHGVMLIWLGKEELTFVYMC